MRPTYAMIFKMFCFKEEINNFQYILTWHDTILRVFDLLEYQISLMNKLIFLVSKGFLEFIWEKNNT